MSLVSFMSEPMSDEQSSLMFNPLSNIVRSIIADANGAMFDPSDMTTMFQDAAGTTPVTAIEQPVGKILDKSGNGNHATQSVTASRPVLSARYNLLTKTEDFADASITKNNLTVVSDVINSPIGTLTGDLLLETKVTGAHEFRTTSVSLTAGTTYKEIIAVKYAGRRYVRHGASSIFGSLGYVIFDIVSGVITYSSSGNVVGKIYTLEDGWFLLEIVFTATVTTTATNYVGTNTDATTGIVFAGNTELGVYVWGVDLKVASEKSTYQRVNTATDYDTDPAYFPKYLRFDGIDDYLNLPYMGLYANGSSGITCARDAVSQATDTYILSERSTTDADPKYFPSRQLASGGNMDAYIADDNAAVVLDTVGSPFGGAANAVIRSIVDSGNNLKLFKNGALAANDNYTRSGTLTLNNTTIGASVSTTTSNYTSMKLYGLIVTKSALTDAQRVRCERFLARKAGVML